MFNLVLNLLFLHLFKYEFYGIRDPRLSDSNADDLNAGRPHNKILVKALRQFLIEGLKKLYINLVESVFGAELVDLVVYLVIDPEVVIVGGVVLQCLINKLLSEPVDNLDPLEIDDHPPRSAAGYIGDDIGLQFSGDFLV